jgi:hypothetical protein
MPPPWWAAITTTTQEALMSATAPPALVAEHTPVVSAFLESILATGRRAADRHMSAPARPGPSSWGAMADLTPSRIAIGPEVASQVCPTLAQGSAFGGVTHNRDHLLACAEQLQNSVTSDASRASENSDSTH